MLNQAPAHTACGSTLNRTSTPQATPKPRAQAKPCDTRRRVRCAANAYSTVQYWTVPYWTVRTGQCAPASAHIHTYMRHGGKPFSTARECPRYPALKNLTHGTSWKLKILARTPGCSISFTVTVWGGKFYFLTLHVFQCATTVEFSAGLCPSGPH